MIRNVKKHEELIIKAKVPRSTEKEKLGRERVVRLKQILTSIGTIHDEVTPMKRRNILCFMIILQIPFHNLITLIELVIRHGAAETLVVYLTLLSLFGCPLYLLPILLGVYTRRGYFSIWKCIPLLKGIAYTVMLMISIPQTFNASFAGLSLLYIYDLLGSNIPWQDCKFPRATNTCIPMHQPTAPYNCSAKHRNDLPTFSTLNYFRFNKQNQYFLVYPEVLGPIKLDWAISVLVTWVLIFVFALKGFKGFQNVMKFLHVSAGIGAVMLFLISIVHSSDFHPANALYYQFHHFTKLEFWIRTFLYVCECNEPGSSVYLSSYLTPNVLITVEAMIINSFKLLISAIFIIWIPLLIQSVFYNYNIPGTNCLRITGPEIIFAAVPDLLSRPLFPQLWLIIWFVCIFIHCFGTILYTLGATVESLVDNFPILNIYRVHVCILFCSIYAIVSLVLCTRLSMEIMMAWKLHGAMFLYAFVFTIFTLSIIFIYTISELSNDFQFLYGAPIAGYWLSSWKTAPFIILCEMIFIAIQHSYITSSSFIPSFLTYLTYVSSILLLTPIFGVMLWKYCMHVKYQMVSSVIQPEHDWGCYNAKLRLARRNFDPNLEIRYKSSRLKCTHHCLTFYSKKFKKVLYLYNIKKTKRLSHASVAEMY